MLCWLGTEHVPVLKREDKVQSYCNQYQSLEVLEVLWDLDVIIKYFSILAGGSSEIFFFFFFQLLLQRRTVSALTGETVFLPQEVKTLACTRFLLLRLVLNVKAALVNFQSCVQNGQIQLKCSEFATVYGCLFVCMNSTFVLVFFRGTSSMESMAGQTKCQLKNTYHWLYLLIYFFSLHLCRCGQT